MSILFHKKPLSGASDPKIVILWSRYVRIRPPDTSRIGRYPEWDLPSGYINRGLRKPGSAQGYGRGPERWGPEGTRLSGLRTPRVLPVSVPWPLARGRIRSPRDSLRVRGLSDSETNIVPRVECTLECIRGNFPNARDFSGH